MGGVNFLLYEPIDEKKMSLCNVKLVPPFDGSVSGLAIARTEQELEEMIRDRYQTPSNILEGYMQPLDLSILNQLIK